jgi:hypothetical protein
MSYLKIRVPEHDKEGQNNNNPQQVAHSWRDRDNMMTDGWLTHAPLASNNYKQEPEFLDMMGNPASFNGSGCLS